MPKALCNLNDWLSFQEQHHPKSWDLGLERISRVWANLGAPDLAHHIITIAGTNGKGSCVRWLEALCVAHDISVMSFSSPHLLAYNERIREHGKALGDADLVRAFGAIEAARDGVTLTYFEWSALAAFFLMAERKPQVAVLEVGLGGRLDAVNLINAHSAIFTRIGLDHQDWLGHDIETIAIEKAGILREGQQVFFADKNPPKSLQQAVEAKNIKALWQADGFIRDLGETWELDLYEPIVVPRSPKMHGSHQLAQFAACALALYHAGFELNPSALARATQTIDHFGRLMTVSETPLIVVDVAHNADSAEILAAHVRTLKTTQRLGKWYAVCGMLNDKDHRAVFAHLADLFDEMHLASLDGTRGTTAHTLAQSALAAGITAVHTYDTVPSALQAVKASLTPYDGLVVLGSFVTVAQALPVLATWERGHHAE